MWGQNVEGKGFFSGTLPACKNSAAHRNPCEGNNRHGRFGAQCRSASVAGVVSVLIQKEIHMPRSYRKSVLLMAAAMSLAVNLGTPLVRGDDQQHIVEPQQQTPKPAEAAKPAEPAAQAFPVPAGGYNHAQLGEVLRNLGYDPKAFNNSIGTIYYVLSFERDGWTFSMTVSISQDNTLIWFSSPLTEINDVSRISPQGLLKLMEENEKIGPSAFSFRPEQSNRIYLSRPLANQGLTPALFRASFDEFISNVKQSEPLWNAKAIMK
jgi:hypothetical protein